MTVPGTTGSTPDHEMGIGSDDALPVVTVLLTKSMREQMLSPSAIDELSSVCRLRTISDDVLTASDLPSLLDDAEACLTGWGTPPLGGDILEQAPSVKLIAHTAGSIRKLLPNLELLQRLRVSHAAGVIADAVAEYVIAAALMALRELDHIDREMRGGWEWYDLRSRFPGRLLGAQTVGVVGAGYVGRTVIGLLRAFGTRILVFDPILTEEQASELGVELTSLEDLLASSDIVSLHAPVLPETRGMIGARELALLRDDTIFINSARSALIDEDALVEELKGGRIRAVLDVFDTEPLPADSVFRTLPGTRISPHVAGHSLETHRRQGQAMVDEIKRFLDGEQLQHEVTQGMLASMA